MAQRIPLPLTVSCFSKIQIGSTFLVPAHPGSPGQRAVKQVCVWLLPKFTKLFHTVKMDWVKNQTRILYCDCATTALQAVKL